MGIDSTANCKSTKRLTNCFQDSIRYSDLQEMFAHQKKTKNATSIGQKLTRAWKKNGTG